MSPQVPSQSCPLKAESMEVFLPPSDGGGNGCQSVLTEGCRTGWVTHWLGDLSEIFPLLKIQQLSLSPQRFLHALGTAVSCLPRQVGTALCRGLGKERLGAKSTAKNDRC